MEEFLPWFRDMLIEMSVRSRKHVILLSFFGVSILHHETCLEARTDYHGKMPTDRQSEIMHVGVASIWMPGYHSHFQGLTTVEKAF